MEKLIRQILDHPHHFTKSDVPCALWCLLEVAQDETPRVPVIIVIAPAHRVQQRWAQA